MYNHQQQSLIDAPITSRVVGVAGAGTGKTTTIIARTKRVLKEYSTGTVLLITFTRAAANDLRERIAREIDDTRRVMVGTFHSIIGQLIRDHAISVGLEPNFTVIDEKSTQIMFRNIVESNPDYLVAVEKWLLQPNEKKLGAKHFSTIANLTSVLVNMSYPEELMSGEFSDETRSRLQKAHFSLYEGNIEKVITLLYNIFRDSITDGHRTNTVTYDHILFIGYMMVSNNMLETFSDGLAHTIVDEYQDTNMLQDEFIRKVAGDKLTLVGDIDQAIYEFRGGKPSLIADHASESDVYNLSHNYRSYQPILNLANNVIKHNQTGGDIREALSAMKPQDENYTGITLAASQTDQVESDDIIKRIKYLHDSKGVAYRDMAILIRSRITLPAISHALTKGKIPVNDTTKYADFMRSEVVTDILNYFKVFTNPKDIYAFLGIINTPKQGIGPTRIQALQEQADKHKLGLVEYLLSPHTDDLTPKLKEKVQNFIDTYQKIIDLNNDKDFSLLDLFEYIINAFQYSKWIDGLKDNNKLNRDLITLRGLIREFDEDYTENHKDATLYDIANAFVFDMTAVTREETSDGVCLTTIHNAKGLEWKHVFLIGLEHENFPGRMVEDDNDLEGERRLMYVAITRAKDSLHMYVSQRRITSQEDLTPSVFIEEMGQGATHILKD